MTKHLKISANPLNTRSFLSRLSLATTLLVSLLLFTPAWAKDPLQSVNINSASAEVIAETLSGIGLKKAQAIVAWRENHGLFTHKEQLTAIKGIGESTLAKNTERIRLE